MWRKVKTFFHVFKSSLFPQPTYYHKLTKAQYSFSFKYFVFLIFVLNSIFICSFVIKYSPSKINRFINSVTKQVGSVPKEMVVNVNKGSLFTNYNRPYFFWATYNNQQKLLLVIDETADPGKIDIYNTYILVTSREIVVKLSQGPKIISLKNFGRHTFQAKDFEKASRSLKTFSKLFYLVYFISIPCLLIILPLVSFSITLFYLFIISLIVYLFFKTYYHKRIHFKKTLQLSFHAVSLPLILDYFLNIFRPTLPTNIRFKLFIPTPLAFLIILVMFVFAAVYEAYQDKHFLQHKRRAS